jgi:predicted nucleic acid-binding protein
VLTALLDTSVLWPSLQRDFLLSLAAERLYRPIWSAAVLAELERHEAVKLAKRGLCEEAASSRAAFLVSEMRHAFDDAEVQGWEALEGRYGLPDPDDEHVVAAAEAGGASVIVTANLKDFPARCMPAGLEVLSAGDFAYRAVSLGPRSALRAVAMISARSGKKGPARSVDELFEVLVARYGLVDAVNVLRERAVHGDEG